MSSMIEHLPQHSQFPFPLHPTVKFKRCWIRCGKLNARKQKYIIFSRNCIYYYSDAAIDGNEGILPTGVIPLLNLLPPTKKMVTREICEILVKSKNEVIPYIRIVNEKDVIRREKKVFCFEFGRK